MSADNFTGQFISSTFQRLLQLSDLGDYITDGTGSVVDILPVTSSYALTASYIIGGTGTGTPNGPINSIQYNAGGGNFGGSSNLLFDDITKIISVSGTLAVSGNQYITGSLFLTGSAAIVGLKYIDFDRTANPAHLEGRVHWTDDTKTLQVDTDVNNFMIELGHQNVVRVYNPYNFDLTAGTVVYISGSQGAGRPQVATSSYSGDPTSAGTVGLVAQTIPSTGGSKTGYVVTSGILRNINLPTSTYSVGDRLFLSSSGQFTNVVPDAPNHEVRLGKVISTGANGIIYVDIMNGYELDELHDVKATNPAYGDLFMYSGSVWTKSKQLSGSYGITGSLDITGSLQVSIGSNTQPSMQVNSEGVLVIGSYTTTPTAVEGGFIYSGSEYFLGFQ